MKRIIVALLLVSIITMGCAVSSLSTSFGSKISESYKETMERGVPSAKQIIQAWPFISGQIKGLVHEDYKTVLPPVYTSIVTDLDDLVAKPDKTMEDEGKILGLTVRLEVVGGKYFVEHYGTGLFGMILKALK